MGFYFDYLTFSSDIAAPFYLPIAAHSPIAFYGLPLFHKTSYTGNGFMCAGI
jgi:hypothetical protein